MPLEKETQYHNYFIQITAYPKTAINNRRQQPNQSTRPIQKGKVQLSQPSPRQQPDQIGPVQQIKEGP